MGIIGSAFVGTKRVYGAGVDRLSFSPLLDDYPGAVGAYSLRQLSSTYTGGAVKVRRSGDNAKQDIGFDSNGDLDVDAMTSFVTAGGGTEVGLVEVFYDQSGNGNNITNTFNAAQQPTISFDTPIIVGTRPAMSFDGSDFMTTTNIISNTADKTTFNVYKPDSTSGTIMDLSSNTGTGRAWSLMTETALRCVSRTYVTTAGTANTYSLLEMWQDGITIDNANQFKMYLNGTYIPRASGAAGNLVTTTGNFYLGNSQNGSIYFDGTQQEIVIYPSALSDADREGVRDNINNYYSVY